MIIAVRYWFCVICSYLRSSSMLLDMYWISRSRGKLCSLLCRVCGCLLIINAVYPGLQAASQSEAGLAGQPMWAPSL